MREKPRRYDYDAKVIIASIKDGLSYRATARLLGLSVNVVAGVMNRHHAVLRDAPQPVRSPRPIRSLPVAPSGGTVPTRAERKAALAAITF